MTHMRHGGHQVGRGVAFPRVPQPFGIPRPHLRQPLPANGPAVVRPFEHQRPARLVAAVTVVVTRPQVAKLVEGQFLRIAQAPGEDFEAGAVGFAPEDRTRMPDVGERGARVTWGGEHIGPAVRYREVETSVRPLDEPVQIMSAKRHMHAEARQQIRLNDAGRQSGGIRAPRLRHLSAPKLRMAQGEPPHVGNAGEPHVAAVGQYPRRNPADRGLEAIGKG